MADEDDETNVLLLGVSGSTKEFDDPVASAPSITTATHGLYNGSGSQIAVVPVPQPAGTNLSIETGHRNISGTIAPVHWFRDPVTNYTYLEIQYTYDPEDDYPRIDITPYPDLPHRGKPVRHHPSNSSTIVASASSCYTTETNSSEWPDLH